MPRKKVKVIKSRKKSEERVMVVSRNDLFSLGGWHGLQTENLKKYIQIISKNHKFISRAEAEEDPYWKQIIPYLVFEHKSQIFTMQRKGTHTDVRLAHKVSIGIGGHLRDSPLP